MALLKNALIRQLEFRLNFLGSTLCESVWISTQVLFFHSILRLAPTLGGWTEGQVWFFVSSYIFVDALYMFFIHENMKNFSGLIKNGLMDFHLLRPASALFLAFFRIPNTNAVFNFTMSLGLLTWTLTHFDLHMGPAHFGLWLFYILLGFTSLAALCIGITSLAFWTTQASSLTWFFFELYRLGSRPQDFYVLWLKRFILVGFPAAAFISVPVQLATGRLSGPLWLLYPLIVCALAVTMAAVIWRRGVRVYEGALS